jgi:hypothetical protein
VKSVLLCLLLVAAAPAGLAADIESQVPLVLEPWIPWVLQGKDQRACPLAMEGGERLCAWPGRLELDLDTAGGRFTQRWRVYAEGWVPLPRTPEHWPEDVQLGEKPAVVVARKGIPAVKMGPGDWTLNGRFLWGRLPEGLAVPPAIGLVSLRVAGAAVPFPHRDASGRLWLGETKKSPRTAGDTLKLEVYRRLEDDTPLQVLTRLDMDVTGTAREVRLGPVVLNGGIPLRISSPLPSRLEPDGTLRLQVRPGRWLVEVAAHHPQRVDRIGPKKLAPPWPGQEVWVFAAHPELREVEVTGAEPLDPRQTRLPADWARLPAYRVRPGEALAFAETGRGDSGTAPDRLGLERDIWLDFSGGGYTLRDRITGELRRSWRLQVDDALALGQVVVDGEPRFITQFGDPPRRGVEVRQGRLQLVADSRIEGDIERVPASGWALDLQSLQTHLHLPPGWDLLAVAGVDNLPDSWINRWTLLDLFLVLITALAAGRLWGWGWGAITLGALALTWQEPAAPRLIWLNLLAAIALLRLLPTEPPRAAMVRLRRLLGLYYRGSLVVLALIALPFLVNQVRNAIYPQLARPLVQPSGIGALPAPSSSMTLRDEMAEALPAPSAGILRKGSRARAAAPPAPAPLPVVDPDARVQTGPGVPTWRWTTLDLTWSGPLPRDHNIRLWLVSPRERLVLTLLESALLLALGIKAAGLREPRLRRAPAAAMLVLAVGLSAAPLPSPAQGFPPPALLETLRARLLEPPDCLPACADVPHMVVETSPATLRLRMRVNAREAIALPVPGNADSWAPTELLLNGKPFDQLRRSADGGYRIPVPEGISQIELAGPLPPRAQVELPLPLRPHRVETAGDGWRVAGIDEQGHPGGQLQLVRVTRKATSDRLQPAEPPPLLRIERVLHLGVDWRVATRALRLSPTQPPLLIDVPLIPGEQVLSEGARVKDGRLLVSLAPGQQEAGWESRLEPVAELTLEASSDARLSEEWRVDVSPLWHLQASGIPAIHAGGRADRWLPTWRPWPGERVRLAVSRPAGVPGPTLTVDQSTYRLTPGRRLTESTLDLVARSSQGGDWSLRLPEGAELQQVRIDGVERPLRLEDRKLVLPLVPASQAIHVQWRQPTPLTMLYAPPAPDLGMPSVNASVQVQLGADRWVLFTGGPALGPAVLFWGVVIVLVPIAIALGRSRMTALTTRDWLLLGLGLTQAGVWVALLVVGWLFALALRGRTAETAQAWRFNLMQVGLATLTLIALAALFAAVQQGLLGSPQMQIAGNGSSALQLNWYQDRSRPELPRPRVFSVPILVYRALMLAWALWLAFRLLAWLRWGWAQFATPVLWRESKLKLPQPRKTAKAQEPA